MWSRTWHGRSAPIVGADDIASRPSHAETTVTRLPSRRGDLARRFVAEHAPGGAFPADWNRRLAAAGYVAPHWPKPWGLEATPAEQLAIDEVLRELRVPRPLNPIGIGWAGPDAVGRRHRRTAAAVPARDPRRLRALVPALQRTRRGQRPRVAADPRGARRRRVRRQRPEGVDDARARRAVTASCSRARTPTPNSTRASPTSSSTCARPASRCDRSCR